jgi:chaperonin GroEL
MDKVGKEGVITSGGRASRTTRPRRGHAVRPQLHLAVPSTTRTSRSLLEVGFVLLHDKKISNIRELLPLLEQVAKAGKRS